MLYNTNIIKKFTGAIEVRLIDEASGPIVVEKGFLVAVKLHSRAQERRPEPCEGQGDVLLEGDVQWDSPHPERGGHQQEVLHLCSTGEQQRLLTSKHNV